MTRSNREAYNANMEKARFGMVGLGTMGRNFLLNAAEKGFRCVGYDLDPKKRDLLLAEGAKWNVAAADSVGELVGKLTEPRTIMLLVPAGKIVDLVIDELIPHLQPGDTLIDGGNSHFRDTERREAYLRNHRINFLGVGVSGGEEGARLGPSIMIGGDEPVYRRIADIFEAVAAQVDGEPCAAHVGSGFAGHFVKMVHNGIEYAMMQLIAETYDLLRAGGMTPEEAAELFAKWNKGPLESFLIEITAFILKKKDEDGSLLINNILDTAGQKGTGKWTSEVAFDLGVPIPSIDAAVTMRQISSRKAERLHLSDRFSARSSDTAVRIAAETIEKGLHLSFVLAYTQGMALLQAASAEFALKLDMAEIAKIWRGGCIIRSRLLNDLREAFTRQPDLANLMASEIMTPYIRDEIEPLRQVTIASATAGVPAMAFADSFNYLAAFSAGILPANLLQAQRDLFGAHTYQRLDRDGTFHTIDWMDADDPPPTP